ncbi:MAG: ATP-dependent zinc metalloprotease FtsH [Turicibacter sp.]|nr:ATP-dependent zinc metalloprotease FtsH [Turicibacter sp.]
MGPRNVAPYVMMLIMSIGLWLFFQNNMGATSRVETVVLTINEFISHMEDGDIEEFAIRPISGENNTEISRLSGVMNEGTADEIEFVLNVYNVPHVDLITNLAIEHDVDWGVVALPTAPWTTFLYIGAMVVIFAIILTMMRSAQRGNNKAFNFGNNRAQLSKQEGVSFNDVAGNDEEKEELVEIVDFLKRPKKYQDMGARIPKGILLTGPPGTGKTLLARAVAGEAGVPFYSISGSDFVEMFVGVGASRVRDMFAVAKKTAPCIVFIDEIDAVGRQRGAGMGGGNDEREQTLNQLLIEMDGFGPNSGIVIMAATNRADVLDPALLRPGRFDRKVIVGLPDVKGREEILKIHARNKKLAPSVTLADVARRTPGFSGADIENLLNEAALLAARDNRKQIEMPDIDEASDRVLMGPAKKSKVFSAQERKTIAYHEAGHAVVGLKLENSEVVQKVTIIPRGEAGGYALLLPEEEKFLKTKQDMINSIMVYLGGRVAEELTFGEISTGAGADFQSVARIARDMVAVYGMSKLGPIQFEQRSANVFLGRDYSQPPRNFSDNLALKIDEAVAEIINECYEQTRRILTENTALMTLIAETLLVEETLTKEQIDELSEKGRLEATNYGKASDLSVEERDAIKEEYRRVKEEMISDRQDSE